MASQIFTKRTRLPLPASEVFAWHTRPGALQRLTPPWEQLEILEQVGGIENGGRVTLRLKTVGIPMTWIVEHRDYVPGEQFRDVMIAGPFARWEHTHRVEPDGPDACYLSDHIEYTLPLGNIGAVLGKTLAHDRLDRVFAYRHRVIAEDLALHRPEIAGQPLTVAVSGARGLIGSALIPLLTTAGHRIKRIVRGRAQNDDQIGWSPTDGTIESAKLEGVDAVVHLAGESVVGRWTAEKKRRIRESRVEGTRLLTEALTRLKQPPAVLINASAVGYYGNRSEELLDESTPPGEGFLAEVCVAWEEAAQRASEAGCRVVMTRFGLVLSPRGGSLGAMLPAFRLGVAGPLGDGQQWWSWITLNDAIGAMAHALVTLMLDGPMNVVSPDPVTNRTFTRTLGHVLHRPTMLAMPRAAARLALGEFADEGMFASVRVRPARLEQTGYVFRDPQLEPALRGLLGR